MAFLTRRKVFAKGNRAWGQCQRCGLRGFLRNMIDDPRTGLKVHATCAETRHPQEVAVLVEDAIGLEDPAPDLDSPGDSENTDLEYEEGVTFPCAPDKP